MDIALLKTFLILHETKSFTVAAQRLHRSQSAISLQVAKLEGLIGKPLFKRDSRNVVLTEEGEELLGYARRMLKVEEELLRHFKEPILSGKVSFGSPEDIATAYLPEILAHFVRDYPGVHLHVNCEFTLDLLKGYEEGRYDLVLIKQDPDKRHPSSQAMWKESLVWVGSPKVAAKMHNSASDKLPLILAPSPCVYRSRATDALDKAFLGWRIVYTSPSLTGTIAAVKAGLGISVLPLKMVPRGVEILEGLPVLKDAQIALLHKQNPSPAISAFAHYIAHELALSAAL